MDEIKKIIEKINSYSSNQIDITDYCRRRMGERNIEETLLIFTLFSKELYEAKMQDRLFDGKPERRFKLTFRISSKYSLIIVVSFYQNILKVINTIKTSKGIEKQWKKQIFK